MNPAYTEYINQLFAAQVTLSQIEKYLEVMSTMSALDVDWEDVDNVTLLASKLDEALEVAKR